MSVMLAALCALCVSLVGIGYLLAVDAKRRRVFRLGPALPRPRTPGWLVVLVPGIVLLWVGLASAFLVWFGATTVLSWLIVSWVPVHRRRSG